MKNKKTKKIKILILIVIMFTLVTGVFVSKKVYDNNNSSKFNIDTTATELKDNSLNEDSVPIYSTLPFNMKVVPKKNLTSAKKIIEQDLKEFASVSANIEEYELRKYGNSKLSTCSYIKYSDTPEKEHNIFERTMAYFYDENTTNNKYEYLCFHYMHTIKLKNKNTIDANFIANDIEKTLGKLEDRDSFIWRLEKDANLALNPEYSYNSEFNTASGVILKIDVNSSEINISARKTIYLSDYQ